MSGIDFSTFEFAAAQYLWLLVVPAILLALWILQVRRRRADAHRYVRERILPVRERFTFAGDLAFWACLIVAASLCIVALARPEARISSVRKVGVDIVILQDASASMYVADVAPDRWRRSQQFLRQFAEALSWKGDRVALALFAHRAAPQLRLTRDPNSLFFFLDHLGNESPFPLQDDTTWDTNIEEGVYWGLRLVQKDEELFGKSKNVKAFVVVSDGQAWSGNVENSLKTAHDRDIPVYVVGVGTTTGGIIPDPGRPGENRPPEKVRATLDRDSLREIASVGGGTYFEIGRETDRDVAFKIISSVRRRATLGQQEESHEELYWRFLFAAAVFLCLGTIVLKEGTELWWQAAGTLAAILILTSIIR